MTGRRYVAGFLFAGQPASRVLLVRKIKGPAAVLGRWNGIGGKIERGEWPRDAMVRELREEAGIDSAAAVLEWENYASLVGPSWQVVFFRAFAGPHMPPWRQCEAELIREVPLARILQLRQPARLRTVANLPWLIHLALDRHVRHARIEDEG